MNTQPTSVTLIGVPLEDLLHAAVRAFSLLFLFGAGAYSLGSHS